MENFGTIERSLNVLLSVSIGPGNADSPSGSVSSRRPRGGESYRSSPPPQIPWLLFIVLARKRFFPLDSFFVRLARSSADALTASHLCLMPRSSRRGPYIRTGVSPRAARKRCISRCGRGLARSWGRRFDPTTAGTGQRQVWPPH